MALSISCVATFTVSIAYYTKGHEIVSYKILNFAALKTGFVGEETEEV